MNLRSFFLCMLMSLFFSNFILSKQNAKLIAGPMQGHTTAHETSIWLMVQKGSAVSVTLKNKNNITEIYRREKLTQDIVPYKKQYPITFEFNQLQANTEYKVEIVIDGALQKKNVVIKTLAEQDYHNFNFLVGSCALYVPWGLRWIHPGIEERIYPHLTKAEGEFMLWLGDYLYYFPINYRTANGMYRKHVKTRKRKHKTEFVCSRPQYAIWDDHEFGPNDSNREFKRKEEALKLHQQFWANPGYGEPDNPGCYFNFAYQDAEFFMTDGRYYRSEEKIEDAEMLGKNQLTWLIDKLKNSKATFKFIAIGSQVINEISANESYALFPKEKQKLMDFLLEEKITGVIFLSGDRHHTELLKKERPGAYPLYDFTSSPITSFRRKTSRSSEKNNPLRVPNTLVDRQNFGQIAISGEKGSRVCTLYTYDNKGKLVWEHSIKEEELNFFKK